MQINLSCFWGSLALMSVAASILLLILGASAELRHSSPRIIVNRTSAEWSNILKPDRKEPDLSDNTNLKAPINPKQTQVEELSPSIVHSSFDDNSRINDKSDEVHIIENLIVEQPTEVGNGLTDTGQAVVLSLLETDSSPAQLQTESLGLVTSSENMSDLLNGNSEQFTEVTNRTSQGVEHFVMKPEANEDPVQDIKVPGPEIANAVPEEVDKEVVVTRNEVESTVEILVKEGDVVQPEEAEPSSNLAQPPDDIPLFSEWAQKKQLEEAEKNKVHNITMPISSSSLKLRSKNYASPDCGAKIVASNSEAVSASSVLSPSRDEYLLNPCNNRIWLVMELCDSIQAKKLDIANFELFSSSPKELAVSVSDRFPTRDWRSVGQFTANDVRDVQSFNLYPHLFGKFVKVEIKSHYGSEHFCPVSLIRVYGTSEFEVLETEDEVHHAHEPDDEDEGTLGGEDASVPPRNLYGLARDAVKSIVKAAEALVIRSETTTHVLQNSSGSLQASTPSHLVVCDNCSSVLYNDAFRIMEHRHTEVFNLVQLPFVKDALHSGPICAEYGLDFGRRRPTTYPSRQDPGDYLSSLLPSHYLVALCNALAVIEKMALVNASVVGNMSLCPAKTEFEQFIVHPKATCSVDSSSCHSPIPSPEMTPSFSTAPDQPLMDVNSSQINPTKPTNISDDPSSLVQAAEIIPSEVPHIDHTVSPELTTEGPTITNVSSINEGEAVLSEIDGEKVTTEVKEEIEPNGETFEEELISEPLDSLLSELKEMDTTFTPATPTTATPPQKESVFVRLTNRIKALERNMSLSGQYLEELSRRYRRQVEEMSRTLNRTLVNLETESKHREERELHSKAEISVLREQLASLAAMVDSLIIEREGWNNKVALIGQHLILIAIEVLVFVIVWYIWRLCSGDERSESGKRKWSLSWRSKKAEPYERRRKSVDGVSGHRSPILKKKRPSEVALNISGTYSDLLITESPMSAVEGVWCNPKVDQKRRRRKRRDAMSKSISSAILHENADCHGILPSSQQDSEDVTMTTVRRSSLSELGSVSIPVNGVQRGWNNPLRIEELPPEIDSIGVPKLSTKCVINVPKHARSKNSLEGENNCNSNLVRGSVTIKEDNFRRLSSPSFMKTALSTRADRRGSEEPIAHSDDWEYWQGSRNSSQASSILPTVAVNDVQHDVDQEQPGQLDSGQTSGRKKGNSLKKIVKRFF